MDWVDGYGVCGHGVCKVQLPSCKILPVPADHLPLSVISTGGPWIHARAILAVDWPEIDSDREPISAGTDHLVTSPRLEGLRPLLLWTTVPLAPPKIHCELGNRHNGILIHNVPNTSLWSSIPYRCESGVR